MKCDLCKDQICYQGKSCLKDGGNAVELYEAEDRKLHRVAALIEGSYYMKKTRVEELILFSLEMGYERLGVAFCIGLKEEAAVLCSYLRTHFEVFSVCCKICGISKDQLNLKKIIEDKDEVMCNPIFQAKKLAECRTDLNVTVGLCIGHDILFNRHSKAPVTALVVKDRVLAHNPVGAIYTRYYRKIIGSSEK